METSLLVRTKLLIPQTRPSIVPRQRLIDRLNEGASRKLILVTAPAGYGKTTLLCDWARKSQIPVVWFSLDEADNDEDRFISHLIAALSSAPDGMNIGKSAYLLRQLPQPPAVQSILTVLVNEIVEYGKEFALVLDDYHHIRDEEVQALLSNFLNYFPANLHLVLSSRTIPQLSLARLRVQNQLVELRASDLKFSAQEVRAFLSEVMSLRLSQREMEEMEEFSEGWAASLQLAAISIRDQGERGRSITHLTTLNRFIIDYMAEEVFADQPAEIQQFLLKTCILERFSAPLCNAVVGVDNSQTYLDFLVAENLFTSALDPEYQWFRYHQLFSDFLKEKLMQSDIDQSTLNLRSAQWYEAEGFTAEAVSYYLNGAAFDHAVRLIDESVIDLMGRGEFTTIGKWIAELPPDVILGQPRIAIAQEWSSMIRNPVLFWASAAQRMDYLAGVLEVQPEELRSRLVSDGISRERRNQLCEYAIILAFVSRQEGKFEQAISMFELAYSHLSSDSKTMRALAKGGLGSIFIRTGEVDKAERAFADAAAASSQANSILFQSVCIGFQALMQVYKGQLNKAKRTYEQGIELMSDRIGPNAPLTGQVWVGLSDVYREQNALSIALEYVNEGIKRGEVVQDIDALRDGYITLARVKHAADDVEGSQQALHAAKVVAERTQIRELINQVESWEARLALMQGDIRTAKGWVSRRQIQQSSIQIDMQSIFFDERATYASFLLSTKELERASEWLDYLLKRLDGTGKKHELIAVLILQAKCSKAQGRYDEAIRLLGQALLLGESGGYVRVFLDEGPTLAALLRSAGAKGHSPEYVKYLLDCYGEDANRGAFREPLTDRELQVLSLIGQGFTNGEIASELVISMSTVKTHINHIYEKLDVANRTQAVIRAQETGLI